MNIRTIKREPERLDISYLSKYGIKSYGANNLYPQDIANLLRSSSTGAACADRYARFIEGDGFVNDLQTLEVNTNGDTAGDVLAMVARDLSVFGGFALHVTFNAFGDVTGFSHVPFHYVRLCECDGTGYTNRALVCDDWAGLKTRAGKRTKQAREACAEYFLFNPRRDVVLAQISRAGGLDRYRGQLLYFGEYGKALYPIPRADRIITDLSTDIGLSNIKLRNTRNNFLPAAMVVTKASQPAPNAQGVASGYDVANDGFSDELANFQGDECTGNIIEMTVNCDEEKPEILPFPSRSYDKDFTVTDASVIERIYTAFEQEPFLAIRNGKLGFSGTTIHDTYYYYSNLVAREQKQIARVFTTLLSGMGLDLDTEILPLKLPANE